jgi:hypothetical protein
MTRRIIINNKDRVASRKKEPVKVCQEADLKVHVKVRQDKLLAIPQRDRGPKQSSYQVAADVYDETKQQATQFKTGYNSTVSKLNHTAIKVSHDRAVLNESAYEQNIFKAVLIKLAMKPGDFWKSGSHPAVGDLDIWCNEDLSYSVFYKDGIAPNNSWILKPGDSITYRHRACEVTVRNEQSIV